MDGEKGRFRIVSLPDEIKPQEGLGSKLVRMGATALERIPEGIINVYDAYNRLVSSPESLRFREYTEGGGFQRRAAGRSFEEESKKIKEAPPISGEFRQALYNIFPEGYFEPKTEAERFIASSAEKAGPWILGGKLTPAGIASSVTGAAASQAGKEIAKKAGYGEFGQMLAEIAVPAGFSALYQAGFPKNYKAEYKRAFDKVERSIRPDAKGPTPSQLQSGWDSVNRKLLGAGPEYGMVSPENVETVQKVMQPLEQYIKTGTVPVRAVLNWLRESVGPALGNPKVSKEAKILLNELYAAGSRGLDEFGKKRLLNIKDLRYANDLFQGITKESVWRNLLRSYVTPKTLSLTAIGGGAAGSALAKQLAPLGGAIGFGIPAAAAVRGVSEIGETLARSPSARKFAAKTLAETTTRAAGARLPTSQPKRQGETGKFRIISL